MSEQAILQVYQAGALTVIGFGGRRVLDDINVADCRDELVQLVKRHQCQTLAFDLTDVKVIPSGLLGLLASLRQLGVEVHLYNPSADIQEVLEVTKLERLMKVHEVEL
ncbi:MAG: STAS domain-containing protein [Planctomycetaceae bacterium]